MIAAAIANNGGGSIPLGTKGTADTGGNVTAYGVLAQLKDNGSVIDATINPPASGTVDLTNYCVTVGSGKSGPGCS